MMKTMSAPEAALMLSVLVCTPSASNSFSLSACNVNRGYCCRCDFAFEEAFDYGAAHHAGADDCDFAAHDCSLFIVKDCVFAL